MLKHWNIEVFSRTTADSLNVDLKGYTQQQVMREAERRFRNHYGYAKKNDLQYTVIMKETQP